MSVTVLYMSMSLDGFIAVPNAGPGIGLGDGGHRLHEWFLSGADADHKAISGRLAGVNGTVVDDVMTAMSEAKRAAGDKNVLVHGAGTAQLALAAGVLDELEIHLIPVLLGHGRRLFENLDLSIPSTSSWSAPGSPKETPVSPTCTTASCAERSVLRPSRRMKVAATRPSLSPRTPGAGVPSHAGRGATPAGVAAHARGASRAAESDADLGSQQPWPRRSRSSRVWRARRPTRRSRPPSEMPGVSVHVQDHLVALAQSPEPTVVGR